MALEKKRWRKRAVIAAVIILPLIYSVFFFQRSGIRTAN